MYGYNTLVYKEIVSIRVHSLQTDIQRFIFNLIYSHFKNGSRYYQMHE